MHGWTKDRAAVLALALAAGLGAAPSASTPTTPAPAAIAAPETKPEQAVRTKFENGEPISDFFTALAVRFGVMIVQSQPVDAYILKNFELPAKIEDALAIAHDTLEPQGYAILQSVSDQRIILRILPAKEAQKLELSQSPVTFGTQGEKIDISKPQRQVTHLFPITHPEMLEALRHAATQDAAVSAEVAGGTAIGTNLILTGPALKVQHAVETLAKLDKTAGGQIIARTLALQHLDAQSTADALNAGFAQDTAPMKAVVDRRTNSIVITGPEEKVMELMVTLVGQDARRGPVLPPPASRPAFTLPAIPAPPLPQPGATKPGVFHRMPRQLLDETAHGGDNDRLGSGSAALVNAAKFALFVNAGAFL